MSLDFVVSARLHKRSLAIAAPIAAFVLVVLAAGCSEEGRTIQNPIPVQGVAVDVSERAVAVDTTTGAITYVMDVVFKIQVTFSNRCEAERSTLELKTEGPLNAPVLVITPVARYEADESCNIGASGDTVLTLTVQNLSVVNAGFRPFAVRGAIPFEIPVVVDSSLATLRDSSTRYEVHVEDRDTGAVLAGAIVRIERADSSELIGETTTDASGNAVITEDLAGACSRSTPELRTPYTLMVSYSGRTTNLRMREHPARCGVVERARVRV